MDKRPLFLRCLYCGDALVVEHILWMRETPALQELRLVFEDHHTVVCGPKPLYMILDLRVP